MLVVFGLFLSSSSFQTASLPAASRQHHHNTPYLRSTIPAFLLESGEEEEPKPYSPAEMAAQREQSRLASRFAAEEMPSFQQEFRKLVINETKRLDNDIQNHDNNNTTIDPGNYLKTNTSEFNDMVERETQKAFLAANTDNATEAAHHYIDGCREKGLLPVNEKFDTERLINWAKKQNTPEHLNPIAQVNRPNLWDRGPEIMNPFNHTFMVGDKVEYLSKKHGWVNAEVIALCRNGKISLDVKTYVSPDLVRHPVDLENKKKRREEYKQGLAKNATTKPPKKDFEFWEKYAKYAVTSSDEEEVFKAKNRAPVSYPLLDGNRAQCVACNQHVHPRSFHNDEERKEWKINAICGDCQRVLNEGDRDNDREAFLEAHQEMLEESETDLRRGADEMYFD